MSECDVMYGLTLDLDNTSFAGPILLELYSVTCCLLPRAEEVDFSEICLFSASETMKLINKLQGIDLHT